MSNNGVCKICGEEHPLMRSGMCSSCMRSLPVRGNKARADDENRISQKLDTVIAQNAVLAGKVDDISDVTSAFRESSIEAVEVEEDLEEDLEEKEEETGPVGSSFYLVAAIVVCVVVGFLFRDKVLNFISGLKGQDTSGYIS